MADVGSVHTGRSIGAWYLTIGYVLGAIVGFVTFCGCWIYCVSRYGFLVGVGLGWIPAGIVSSIVGGFVTFLWGPVLLLAFSWFALSQMKQSTSVSPSADLVAADASAAANMSADAEAANEASTAAMDAVNEASVAPSPASGQSAAPPPPDLVQVERGVDSVEANVGRDGFSGAVNLTMGCYATFDTAPTWGGWDKCAAIDEYGAEKFQPASWQPTAQYFSSTSVQARQDKALALLSGDFAANRDRIAAIRGLVPQAVASMPIRLAAQQSSEASAAQATANPATDTVAMGNPKVSPSFDCARARSQTVKLICSTPSLAQTDNDLAKAYRTALAVSKDPAGLRAGQREWIMRRNAGPADVGSLAASYSARIAQLNAMTGAAPTQ